MIQKSHNHEEIWDLSPLNTNSDEDLQVPCMKVESNKEKLRKYLIKLFRSNQNKKTREQSSYGRFVWSFGCVPAKRD